MNANFKTKSLWLGAMAMALSGSVLAAGIASTKHNLSSTGTSPSGKSDSDQICVFCHTPHGSSITDPDNNKVAAPLWNRKLSASASYTTYSQLGTATLKGTVLGVGSVSLACLSCHDGTQAMNSVINGPGSGNYNAAGATFGTWTNGSRGAGSPVGAIGGASTDPIPNLGTDLQNDHPIGVQYCGGGLTESSGSVTGTCSNPDFVGARAVTTSDGRTNAQVKVASINSNNVFWVEVDGNTGRGKGDILLYNRSFGGTNGPSVECGSCHDPHQDSTTSGNNGDATLNFMRVTTSGSKICLSCHIK